MWFKSIEVKRFRQFRNAISVADLAPGLNVIAGDNEAGKSTLLQAVRAALFDRYTGSVADAYRPYGERVSPQVRLVFEIDGIEYTLSKVFSRKRDGEASLQAGDGRRWEGPQAEEFLAGLLGFTYAPRGASRAELQGLAGLLWVEQGRAYEEVTLSDRSRQRLYSVFDLEMGELLGGEQGEALQRRIAALRMQYFDKRDNPRGDYRQLREKKLKLAAGLERAGGELRQYEDKTDRLEKERATLEGYREERVIERARERLTRARARQAEVAALQQQVGGGRDKLARIHAEREAARLAWDTRTRLLRDHKMAQAAHEQAVAALSQAEKDLIPTQTRVERLHERIAIQKDERQVTEARARRARDAEQLNRLTQEKEGLGSALREARSADTARRACRAQREALRITEASLAELRGMERDRALAEARLRAVATRVDHKLAPSAAVRLANTPIAGAGSTLLTEVSSLDVDGVGTFTIHPGGEDLEALRARVKTHALALRDRFAEFAVDDISEAEKALKRREALQSEIKQHEARLEALAPEGLAGLEDRLKALESQCQALETRLAGAPEPPGNRAELESEIEALARATGRLEDELREAQGALSRQRDRLITARTAEAAAHKHALGLGGAIDEARRAAPDDQLAAALAEAGRRSEIQEQENAAVERALALENPEAVSTEVERSERVLQQLRDEVQKLEGEIRDLSVELNTLGQRGLAEELAQAESEHTAVARALAHVESEALAVDLLYRTLQASLRSAKEAVAGPVIEKLLPYLRQLMPGATPSVSEDMTLQGIRRGRGSEPFTDLSIGTREQLAVLVRLAYADLLSEKGTPVTVILDDALVNSDDERRDRMKEILYQASKKYQILVLTCHAREYRDSGGRFIALAECKS